MYYQSRVLSKDEAPTTCVILDTNKENYIVEYNEDGEFKTKEIKPEDLQSIDYCEQEISQ